MQFFVFFYSVVDGSLVLRIHQHVKRTACAWWVFVFFWPLSLKPARGSVCLLVRDRPGLSSKVNWSANFTHLMLVRVPDDGRLLGINCGLMSYAETYDPQSAS